MFEKVLLFVAPALKNPERRAYGLDAYKVFCKNRGVIGNGDMKPVAGRFDVHLYADAVLSTKTFDADQLSQQSGIRRTPSAHAMVDIHGLHPVEDSLVVGFHSVFTGSLQIGKISSTRDSSQSPEKAWCPGLRIRY